MGTTTILMIFFLFGHQSCTWPVLAHSVNKTHILVVTGELIWLLFLNILSFNFAPQPNKPFRLTRFERSYVNRPAIVLTNHCQSYTSFLLDVRCSKWSSFFLFFSFFFFFFFFFFFCSCLSPFIVRLRKLFLLGTTVARINSKVCKQTKRCEIITHKYIETNSWC